MSTDASLTTRRTGIFLAALVTILGCAVGCEKTIEDATETELVLEAKEAVASPGPPTTLRLVLQYEGDHFKVMSADPKRGSILPPAIAENLQSLLDGDARLIEYTARDISGAVLVTGYFLVPMIAVSEFQDLNVETRVRRREERLSSPLIRVAIPFDRTIATIGFDGLEPDDDTHPKKWERVSLGEVTVELQSDPQEESRYRQETGKEANDDEIE